MRLKALQSIGLQSFSRVGRQNLYAAMLALASTLILSFSDNFVASVSKEAGLWQFHVFRALFALPLLLLGARIAGVSIKPKSWRLTLLRSITVSAGLIIYFAALGFLPVSQAGAGLFSSPIWVLLFSVLLFGERASIGQILTMVLGFVGVLMLLQPDTDTLSILSVLPLAAGALYGLGMLATRYWCADEEAITLVLGVFSVMGLFSLIMLSYYSLWPPSKENLGFVLRGYEPITFHFLVLTLGQTIAAVLAVALITQAYRLGDASLVAAFEYSFLVFAAFWAWILWGNGISDQGIIAIVLILSSGAVYSMIVRQ